MELLSAATVGRYLEERGLVASGQPVSAVELDWGVSNVVLAVEAPGLSAVVKQALPTLRVREEWHAKRERSLTEAEALRLVGTVTPGAVPQVLDVDSQRCAFVIERAPASWRNWKELLLEGSAEPDVARRLGELLAAWHRSTEHDAAVAERFCDVEAFMQLRVDPYYRTVMQRWPLLARPIGELVEEMLDERRCLVHGDYSPKNALVGDDGIWVVDFEVAHVGDPVFDLAFMLNHLVLKSLHRPAGIAAYGACARAFLAGYAREAEPAYLFGHVGALMVARVDGKSPAEYLDATERMLARALGTRLVLDPPGSVEDAWARLEDASR